MCCPGPASSHPGLHLSGQPAIGLSLGQGLSCILILAGSTESRSSVGHTGQGQASLLAYFHLSLSSRSFPEAAVLKEAAAVWDGKKGPLFAFP